MRWINDGRNNHNVTAQAVEDAELLVLDRAHFDAVVGRYPSMSLALSRVRDELSRATAPGHRAMLEQAAASLESEIAAISE